MSAHAAFSLTSLREQRAARPAVAGRALPLATSISLFAADAAAIFCARTAATWAWRLIHPAIGLENSLTFWQWLALFAVTYAALGAYAPGGARPVEELRRSFQGAAFVCLVLTASLFFLRPFGAYSRGLIALSCALAAALLPLARSGVRSLCCAQSWWGVPVVVLGAGSTAQLLIERLQKHPEIGFRPVACLDDDHSKHGECAGVPVAGPLSMAPRLARSHHIRHALVAMPGVDRENLLWIMEHWGSAFTHLILIPNLFGVASLWVAPRDLGGVLGLELRQNLLVPLNRWAKRSIDILAALFFGTLALPLIAIAALWIRLTSRGSVFYFQEREGEGGRKIRIPKLRTMHHDAEKLLFRVLSESPEARVEWNRHFKLKKDPRILPGVGRCLRKTSLDELPQLWSVLKGDMSLVGPRPFPHYHVEQFSPRFRALRGRVKPGLTGLWQVSDRSNGDLAVQEALDTYYIRNWSPWLDLYIVARTARAVVWPHGAY